MSDAMSAEECRRSQRECALRVSGDIAALRRETKEDIAAIREAVQAIDRGVASIKGHLGLNGNAGDARESAHLHQRNSDEIKHLHRRMEDFISESKKSQEIAITTALRKATKPEGGIYIPRRMIAPLSLILVVMLALAMIAGERGLWTIGKKNPHPPLNQTETRELPLPAAP